jgi:hypothetical protein
MSERATSYILIVVAVLILAYLAYFRGEGAAKPQPP